MADAAEIADAVAEDVAQGVQSSAVDNRSATAMDPVKRLDVADRLAERASLPGNRSAFNRVRAAISVRPGAT